MGKNQLTQLWSEGMQLAVCDFTQQPGLTQIQPARVTSSGQVRTVCDSLLPLHTFAYGLLPTAYRL